MSEFNRKMIPSVMVSIVDRGKAEGIAEICREHQIYCHFVLYGRGTANSDILDLFGLGETEKELVISMVPNGLVPEIITDITERRQLKKPGQGILFTLPLSGVSSVIVRLLDQEVKVQLEKELEEIKKTTKYDLILAVVNQGYTSELFEAAKAAGATGGTILNARGLGYQEAEKFLGVSLHAEKEIVAIVASRDSKRAIMDAIREVSGLNTAAKGVVFSVPVDNLTGIQIQ